MLTSTLYQPPLKVRLTFRFLFLSEGDSVVKEINVWRQQRKRKKLQKNLEKLESKDTPTRSREGRVSEERQGKEKEDQKKGKSPEQREARVTKAVSKPHEVERIIPRGGKKVYVCTCTELKAQIRISDSFLQGGGQVYNFTKD